MFGDNASIKSCVLMAEGRLQRVRRDYREAVAAFA
jgi:hypothetical protein